MGEGFAATVLALAATVGCHQADSAFCSSHGCAWTDQEWARIKTLSPLGPPPVDLSNAYAGNADAARLGQKFYFDPRFSGAATWVDSIHRPVDTARACLGKPINVSCATCHDPRFAGTDVTSTPNTVSIGAGIYDVNGQQTLNAAYFPLLYWNGRSDSLWSQALAVNTSFFSMNSTPAHDVDVINASYAGEYTTVFGESPAVAEVTRVYVNFGKAIAAYETQLVTSGSAFDRWVAAGPGSGWISPLAERGARLFVGKASCLDCHNGPLFSDGLFHDIGVPQRGDHVPTVADCPPTNKNCNCAPGAEESTCLPSGAWAGALKLGAGKYNRTSQWSDDPTATEPAATTKIGETLDAGLPRGADLKGAWRTASLRDVAVTAPYMHDGIYQTLEEVVQHYNRGGVPGAGDTFQLPRCRNHPDAGVDGGATDAQALPCLPPDAGQAHLAVQIKPLDLTDDEVAALVAFLETLTSDPLPSSLTSPPWGDGGLPAGDGSVPTPPAIPLGDCTDAGAGQ
ncbi:MAG TPA: cytochrome c peroxidase [Polyangia bacterium]|nr:cytochrome c peroxidase [Polyangia bacterium]